MKVLCHLATEWQLKAAVKGQLRAILLPLLPEVRKIDNIWVWPCTPLNLFWFQSGEVGERLLKKLPYQIGDLILFMEEWGLYQKTGDTLLKSNKIQTPVDAGVWQPPETMPLEARCNQFEIVEVRVVQAGQVDQRIIEETGIYSGGQSEDLVAVWNESFPDWPWAKDRFMTVLQVKLSDKQPHQF